MIGPALVLCALYSSPLKLDIRLGDTWTYRVEQSFVPPDSTNEAEDEERYTFERSVVVSGVKQDEQDWQVSSRLVKHRFGGEDLPGISGTPKLVERFSVRPDGTRSIEVDRYSNAAEFRLGRLEWFGVPAEPNAAEWSRSWPMVSDYWVVGAKVSFKRSGKTQRLDRDCVLIQMNFLENGAEAMAASGKIEVDENTGIVLAADIRATNAPLSGGFEPKKLHLRVEATSLKLAKR